MQRTKIIIGKYCEHYGHIALKLGGMLRLLDVFSKIVEENLVFSFNQHSCLTLTPQFFSNACHMLVLMLARAQCTWLHQALQAMAISWGSGLHTPRSERSFHMHSIMFCIITYSPVFDQELEWCGDSTSFLFLGSIFLHCYRRIPVLDIRVSGAFFLASTLQAHGAFSMFLRWANVLVALQQRRHIPQAVNVSKEAHHFAGISEMDLDGTFAQNT